ncbi:hypothetical protein GGR55DRAFT_688911 [Xylaria sp. FL0064]|nr:hypothetical protein GGR55DRAFT_688911 [Xylaria sp. FL0064]
MDTDSRRHPAAAPAGDIGNHEAPEFIVALSGIVGFLAVATRLFARHMIRKLGFSDILLVVSFGLFVVLLYNGFGAGIYPGFGVHASQFNPKLATASHFNFKLGTVAFGLGIAFLKIAILLDWQQTFVATGTRNTLFWIIQLLIWSNSIFYFIGTFVGIFLCPPKDVGSIKCNMDLVKFIIASGIINFISDLAILITPHWVIWNLNMSSARKKGISFLFLIGLCATLSALARLICVIKAYQALDTLYYSVIINICADAEQTFGFLVLGWAKRLGSLARSRPGQPLNHNSNHCEREATWPTSPQRRGRDPRDTDTRALFLGQGGSYISLPDQAHIRPVSGLTGLDDIHCHEQCKREQMHQASGQIL